MIFVDFPGIFSQVLYSKFHAAPGGNRRYVCSLGVVVICAYLRAKLARYCFPLCAEKRRRIYLTSYPRESSGEFKGTVFRRFRNFRPHPPIPATATDAGGVYKGKGVHRSRLSNEHRAREKSVGGSFLANKPGPGLLVSLQRAEHY